MNRMRSVYIIDTLTSVDIHEIVKIRGKVIRVYEGVIYKESFKISPSRIVIGKLFALRQKYDGEGNGVMQLLVKLIRNSLYREQVRKDTEESFACKSEAWMMTEYDEKVKEYLKISHAIFIFKMIDDKELEDDVKKLKILPFHLGVFVL